MERAARARVSITTVTLAIALTACGNEGDLVFDNTGTTDVAVGGNVDGGEDECTVEAQTTSVVLGSGCTDGDVEFTFTSGTTVTVEGPVCPDQEFVIGQDDVQLRDRRDG